MDSFVRLAALMSRICGVVAAALIMASVAIVCQMVVTRYFFAQPTTWQTEVVVYALVATTFIGSPYVLLHRAHVNMDILVIYAGKRTRYWLALAANAISLAFCGLLFVYGIFYWHEAWADGWRSSTVTRVPLWIPYASLPIGMGLLSLQLLADLVHLLGGQALPFGLAPRSATRPDPRTGDGTPREAGDVFATEQEVHP